MSTFQSWGRAAQLEGVDQNSGSDSPDSCAGRSEEHLEEITREYTKEKKFEDSLVKTAADYKKACLHVSTLKNSWPPAAKVLQTHS